MFYLRTIIDGVERDIEIYGDQIFTTCLDCGKEMQADEDFLADLMVDRKFDFAGSNIVCEDCAAKRKNNKAYLSRNEAARKIVAILSEAKLTNEQVENIFTEIMSIDWDEG